MWSRTSAKTRGCEPPWHGFSTRGVASARHVEPSEAREAIAKRSSAVERTVPTSLRDCFVGSRTRRSRADAAHGLEAHGTSGAHCLLRLLRDSLAQRAVELLRHGAAARPGNGFAVPLRDPTDLARRAADEDLGCAAHLVL